MKNVVFAGKSLGRHLPLPVQLVVGVVCSLLALLALMAGGCASPLSGVSLESALVSQGFYLPTRMEWALMQMRTQGSVPFGSRKYRYGVDFHGNTSPSPEVVIALRYGRPPDNPEERSEMVEMIADDIEKALRVVLTTKREMTPHWRGLKYRISIEGKGLESELKRVADWAVGSQAEGP